MIKYTKKQQKFISDLYGYDLDKLVDFYHFLSGVQLDKIEEIVIYAKQLIDRNLINTEKMFTISEALYSDLNDELNELNELDETNKLSDKQLQKQDDLYYLIDQLRILNNYILIGF